MGAAYLPDIAVCGAELSGTEKEAGPIMGGNASRPRALSPAHRWTDSCHLAQHLIIVGQSSLARGCVCRHLHSVWSLREEKKEEENERNEEEKKREEKKKDG